MMNRPNLEGVAEAVREGARPTRDFTLAMISYTLETEDALARTGRVALALHREREALVNEVARLATWMEATSELCDSLLSRALRANALEATRDLTTNPLARAIQRMTPEDDAFYAALAKLDMEDDLSGSKP